MSGDVVYGGEEFEVAVPGESPEESSFSHAEQCAYGFFDSHLLFGDVVSVHDGCSSVGRKQGAEDFDEGGFSGAVGSEESEEFAFSDF